ncbi:hypothetical protein CSA56_16465 [candidate division KSB3 bacterium]|uniref:Tricarboxylate transporter n=1 Tax=candidate division KSB3 bacterium TaxID=2044937 RepID=A0A2G6KBL3_9BACT|nr:MAG: hypothetical protein CSA56_16465 [candidate division KSB3 bacterium]
MFVLLLSVSLLTSSALAKYPERNVNIIIPWSAGGMTDILTRPVAKWREDYFRRRRRRPFPDVTQHIQSSKLRMLAITSIFLTLKCFTLYSHVVILR